MNRTPTILQRFRTAVGASRTGAVVAALSLAAMVGAGVAADAQSHPVGIACGHNGALPSAQDLRYAREYRRLLAAKATSVWPGWKGVPPLLQRKLRCEYLIGFPSPPKGFTSVTRLDVLGQPVYAAPAGALTPGPVASTWKVGKVWVVMVPTRDEFQRVLDRQFGPGTIRLTDTTYIRALVHEAFHAHQMSVTLGALPSFGATLDERQAVSLLAPLGDAEARLAGEGEALSAALTAPSLSEMRREAAVFATRRAERRAATDAPAALAAFERQTEWVEGTARYADLRLILLAAAPGYTSTQGIHYTPATGYRSAFLEQLAARAPRPDGIPGRWEDIGAAEAMLLDRVAVGWKQAVLPGKNSLEALLQEAVDVPARLADLRVARIALGDSHLTVALAEHPAQWSSGLTGVDDLGSLDGMLFTFAKDISAAFWTREALIPLDVAFFDSDGKLLSVQTMPLCRSDPCPAYRSPRPYRFALEAPAGALHALEAGTRLTVPLH